MHVPGILLDRRVDSAEATDTEHTELMELVLGDSVLLHEARTRVLLHPFGRFERIAASRQAKAGEAVRLAHGPIWDRQPRTRACWGMLGAYKY